MGRLVPQGRAGGLEARCVLRGRAGGPQGMVHALRVGASRHGVCLGAGRDRAPRAPGRGGAGRAHLGVWSCVGPRGTVPQGRMGCLEAQCGAPCLAMRRGSRGKFFVEISQLLNSLVNCVSADPLSA
ncbi:hypothetical protein KY285_013437 [Solanum tuberosum]|nr:hypothetical protein KY285_013437 [Solanum tuberosum]